MEFININPNQVAPIPPELQNPAGNEQDPIGQQALQHAIEWAYDAGKLVVGTVVGAAAILIGNSYIQKLALNEAALNEAINLLNNFAIQTENPHIYILNLSSLLT